jgi:NADH:ubiquinone oxidoreductase subunit 3 (subunit A)
MPSGWEVYYVVFLSAVLALGIPLILHLISSVLADRKPSVSLSAQVDSSAGDSSAVGRKINTRFFLSANAALILIALALMLIPCVGALHAGADHAAILRTLSAILVVAALAGLGLLYASRKGDLSWLKTFHRGGSSR